jgi:hypothetical protein
MGVQLNGEAKRRPYRGVVEETVMSELLSAENKEIYREIP